jgi:hypothetical protein
MRTYGRIITSSLIAFPYLIISQIVILFNFIYNTYFNIVHILLMFIPFLIFFSLFYFISKKIKYNIANIYINNNKCYCKGYQIEIDNILLVKQTEVRQGRIHLPYIIIQLDNIPNSLIEYSDNKKALIVFDKINLSDILSLQFSYTFKKYYNIVNDLLCIGLKKNKIIVNYKLN